MLVLIKSFHTLIWLVFVACIGFILYSGITGHVSNWSWWAVAAIVGEGAVLLAFKGYCPLTVVARRYSDSQKPNFDIYLPEWLAAYNKQIFGTLFIIGVAAMVLRTCLA